MTILIRRRLARLEAAVKPPPAVAFTILEKPQADAPAEAWQHFKEAVQEAKARGDRVGVLSSSKTDFGDRDPGVEYFATEWEAALARLESEPSQKGLKNRLGDLWQELSGNVFGVRE